ncbi:MAG: methyltransferase domain-containing protein [Thiogranum sp.]|nr:methyltransferase domain-containing protein [Thiogranum sp.]
MIDSSRLVPLVQPGACAGRRPVDRHADVDLLFELAWRTDNVAHSDCLLQRGLNLSQDYFPPALGHALGDMAVGERVTTAFEPGQLVSASESDNCFAVDVQRFSAPLYRKLSILPAVGRFYPKRFIAGVRDIDSRDVTPMRITGVDGRLDIDLNHPLAGHNLSLTATVIAVATSGRSGRGGLCTDVARRLTDNGPGMQARWHNKPTDFWAGQPFARDDGSPDSGFYGQPRLVSHIDRTASAVIGEVYGQWVPDNGRVLDLMASWESHLPDSLHTLHLTGLGMNADELARNPRMDDYVVHDLNADTRLPFPAEAFDAVICSLSIEYLVEPFAVLAEVARVLKPGGRFIVTFSNRWFPPKAIRVWEMLHDYERTGLVLEYFLRSGAFGGLHTWSLRGLPRPEDDKYADRLAVSDPVHAVGATRKTQAIG